MLAGAAFLILQPAANSTKEDSCGDIEKQTRFGSGAMSDSAYAQRDYRTTDTGKLCTARLVLDELLLCSADECQVACHVQLDC